MSVPFLGEIKMFAGTFAPRGYAFCNGQILSISQYSDLFSLLGTSYGGDGQTTFGLPDLRGRAPMHWGQGPGLSDRLIGEEAGVETVTLTVNELPSHSHGGQCRDAPANQQSPVGNVHAEEAAGVTAIYVDDSNPAGQMAAQATATGGTQSHNNMQPFQAINFIIALQGITPSPD